MRFVLVGPAYPFRGGIAQYTASLCAALEEDHEALLVGFRRQYPALLFPGKTQTDESESPFSVNSEALLDSLNPVSWSRVVDRIVEYQPDAVVFQWWQPFFGLAYGRIFSQLKKKLSIPILLLCHNIYSHEESFLPGGHTVEKWLVKRAFPKVDGFLVHADELLDEIQAINAAGEVRKIFHPLYDFYLQWDSNPTAPVDKTARILFFGKIRRYKGLDTLLEALAKVKEHISFKAVIAGEFYLNPSHFKEKASRLGLEPYLEWQDRYISNEEVPALFRNSDVVVLPYVQATQSGVVPVAYQFEIPVIATDVGGLSEVVLDGKTGYLVPPEDPTTLSHRIIEYFEKDKKNEFALQIREFRSRLSWGQVVDAVVGLSKSLAAGRSQ